MTNIPSLTACPVYVLQKYQCLFLFYAYKYSLSCKNSKLYIVLGNWHETVNSPPGVKPHVDYRGASREILWNVQLLHMYEFLRIAAHSQCWREHVCLFMFTVSVTENSQSNVLLKHKLLKYRALYYSWIQKGSMKPNIHVYVQKLQPSNYIDHKEREQPAIHVQRPIRENSSSELQLTLFRWNAHICG